MKQDDRFSGEEILAEVQWRLNAPISSGGSSAYRMVFGSNQRDSDGWDDKDEDLTFAKVTSLPGHVAQQWKLRMMAQEAAMKKIASNRLRRLLAQNW